MDQQRSAFTDEEEAGRRQSSGRREPRRRPGPDGLRQETAALYRAQVQFPLMPGRLAEALSWLPRARLTALGSGLLGVLAMALTGSAAAWLFDGSPGFYGAVFLLTVLACASWVRPADLFAVPVAMPLAFAAGLCFLSGSQGGRSFADRATSLFTALAVNATWLYGGTLLAVCVVAVRKIALMVQRSRVRALIEAQDAEDEDADLRR